MATLGQLVGGDVSATFMASFTQSDLSNAANLTSPEIIAVNASFNQPITGISQTYDATTDFGTLTGNVQLQVWDDATAQAITGIVIYADDGSEPQIVQVANVDNVDLAGQQMATLTYSVSLIGQGGTGF